jgi:hypothetical protein
MDLGHTVVAMVGSQVVQVMCRTCMSYHRYHAPKSLGRAASPAPKAAPREPREQTPSSGARPKAVSTPGSFAPEKPRQPPRWEIEVEAAGGKESLIDKARPYAPAEAYAVGEWLLHAKFGFGHVLAVRPPNKIEVLFSEGEKTLIAARPA